MCALTVRIVFLVSLALCAGPPGAPGRADEKKAPEKKGEKKAPEGVDPKMTSDDADYGYSKAKPIKVGAEDLLAAVKASRKYLDALRDEDGKPVSYVRLGSTRGEGGGILDLYTVTTSAGKELELYVDMYHPKNEPDQQPAPRGLYKVDLTAPFAAPKGAGYYPTEVGAQWVYRIGTREETQIVTDVKEKDGAKLVLIARVEDGKETPAKAISLRKDGVFMVSLREDEFDPAMNLLKLPPKAGEEWTVKTTLANREFRFTVTAGKPETVRVPAGKFEAIPVTTTGTIGGKPFEATHWYALGVGLVKYDSNGSTLQELRWFTRKKK